MPTLNRALRDERIRRKREVVLEELDRISIPIEDVKIHKARMVKRHTPLRSKIAPTLIGVWLFTLCLCLLIGVGFVAAGIAYWNSWLSGELLRIALVNVGIPTIMVFCAVWFSGLVGSEISTPTATWKRVGAYVYFQSIPPSVQETMCWAEQHFPNDELFVDYIAVGEYIPDPYLVLVRKRKRGDIEYYIDQWE